MCAFYWDSSEWITALIFDSQKEQALTDKISRYFPGYKSSSLNFTPGISGEVLNT